MLPETLRLRNTQAGYWIHERFCRGALNVQEAVGRGRLYVMPSGIPVLQAPEADMLSRGTTEPLADMTTQGRFAEEAGVHYLKPTPESATAGDWVPVCGVLLTFDDSRVQPAPHRPSGVLPPR